VQPALFYVAANWRLDYLFWPLLPGLYSMRILPADPRTAGSFIVFPTLPQIVLALVVNTLLYGAGFFAWRRHKERQH
jgi:hypothetical protein